MKGRKKWAVGIIVIASAVLGMTLLTLGDYAVYFYLPHEAKANAAKVQGQDIRVGGMVKTGTVDWKPETLSLSFIVSDLDGSDISVQHSGTPPDMFKEGQGVVVEGRINAEGTEMQSKILMVKSENKSRHWRKQLDAKAGNARMGKR